MRSYIRVFPQVGNDPFTLSDKIIEGVPNEYTIGKFALLRPHRELLIAGYNYLSIFATLGSVSDGFVPPFFVIVVDSAFNFVTIEDRAAFKANLDAIFSLVPYDQHPLD